MLQNTQTSGDLGVYVYRREADRTEISIIKSPSMVAMYGPKGRKFFSSLIAAQLCAERHGFRPMIQNCFI